MGRVYRNFAIQQVQTIYQLMDSIKKTWQENKELIKLKIKNLDFCEECSVKEEILKILDNEPNIKDDEFIEDCELCLQKLNCTQCDKKRRAND